MRIGIPRETWPGEARVSASPSAVRALGRAGSAVLLEQNAGAASGWGDEAYIAAGAEIVPTVEELIDRSEALWKVLRPGPHEARLLRAGQRVYALGHAGPEGAWPELPEGVELRALEAFPAEGDFPVRVAMSEIAGRLAIELASRALQRPAGGRGLLLGGVAGVEPARVVVLGAGVAGRCAARLAAAMGASLRVLDVDVARLRRVALEAPGAVSIVATEAAVERALMEADVVVAAVRDASGRAPRLAERSHLALMQPGAVIVDLSILDGGAFASTPLTTWEDPCAEVDGLVHVGVPNLCGAVPRTASPALSQAALPFVLAGA